MSAPNLIWWFPWERVQLLTHWHYCSFCSRGQLQRETLRPLPKFENIPPLPTSALPSLLNRKPDNPPVVGRPLIPVAHLVFGRVLLVFRHGNPRASMGAVFWSE